MRGPMVLPGPLSPRGAIVLRSRRDEFDDLVVSLVDRLEGRWSKELAEVEFGTEDVPQLPDEWVDEPVPFGSLVRGVGDKPSRIVLFRRPIEMRARTRLERAALVNEVLVEHVADLLGRDPSEIDP